jgi:hypothetical protein
MQVIDAATASKLALKEGRSRHSTDSFATGVSPDVPLIGRWNFCFGLLLARKWNGGYGVESGPPF